MKAVLSPIKNHISLGNCFLRLITPFGDCFSYAPMVVLHSHPFLIVAVVYLATSITAYTIKFQNSCSYTVWAAVGKAPNGQPDRSVSFGRRLDPRASASFGVDDNQLGIRAWGRTGCDA